MSSDNATATTRNTEEDSSVDLKEAVRSLLMAYEGMEMSVQRYLLVILFPSVVFGITVAVLPFFLPVPGIATGPFLVLGLFLPFIALVYPKLRNDRQQKEVRDQFHLFITHITVLSTTNIDRVEVFRTLSKEEDYNAIATEMGHIVALIDTWNLSLDDACRFRARRVSSPLMQDFLERLAYTVGAGQPMSDFLINEQDNILQHYKVRYENELERLNVIKDVYLSVINSTTFGLVFAILLPFLIGIDPMIALSAVLTLYLFVQITFIYVMNNVAPQDPVWSYSDDIALERNIRLRISIIVSVGLSLLLMALTYLALDGVLPVGTDFPEPIYMAIPFTPLLISGLVMRREEKRVKNRDDEFPSFIRALGAVESVKQSSTSSVLSSLRRKDFGSLTETINNLYLRLAMQINSTLAWKYFAAETGSYLIQRFSDMYVVGRRMGGEPIQLGELIEKNFTQVLNLRQMRTQETGTIIGVIYGITATSTFAFFVGLEIVRLLQDITDDLELGQAGLGGLLHPQVYDIDQVRFFLFIAILLNAMLSSMMIRIIDRGHSLSALNHFVVLVWMSVIIAVLTRYLMTSLIAV
ncbi:archaellar assembly protein FlaJ [Natranaeroarchaeum aerophilus]|uniref:Archaellar assembly protein FlaJ n=1 Tax=Natranaeroarchaeum aerophilus TaxID=2917711 RepID=A0AAE3FSR7_9EURY|nr:archaellar assembly protein FlaJ [Natranaeroarchaeum aerophilus]MCL9814644.1 archaellar assembly protein FlaJ [Natranaeroarchaeum aerophilus]